MRIVAPYFPFPTNLNHPLHTHIHTHTTYTYKVAVPELQRLRRDLGAAMWMEVGSVEIRLDTEFPSTLVVFLFLLHITVF